MITSTQVIRYMRDNLDKKDYVSFFIAGSTPDVLIPGSDLDLFIVIKDDRIQHFFDSTSKILKKLLSKEKNVKYSFFRGPIKYKNKGLIHVLTYTEKPVGDIKFGEPFTAEMAHVLRSLVDTSKVIVGAHPKELVKNVDLNNQELRSAHRARSESKYLLLKNSGYIKYREWKKTKNGWRFTYTRIYVGKWQKAYLMHYYEKNLYGK